MSWEGENGGDREGEEEEGEGVGKQRELEEEGEIEGEEVLEVVKVEEGGGI